MAETKFNTVGIVTLLGAILMIVGVFLAWSTGTVDYLLDKVSFEYSGWDIATADDEKSILGILADNLEYTFVPTVMLVLGIVAVILNIVPAVSNGNLGKVFSVLSMLIAIVAIVLSILFYTDVSSEMSIASFKYLEMGAGLGLWLSLIGSLVVAIGSVLTLAKQKA